MKKIIIVVLLLLFTHVQAQVRGGETVYVYKYTYTMENDQSVHVENGHIMYYWVYFLGETMGTAHESDLNTIMRNLRLDPNYYRKKAKKAAENCLNVLRNPPSGPNMTMETRYIPQLSNSDSYTYAYLSRFLGNTNYVDLYSFSSDLSVMMFYFPNDSKYLCYVRINESDIISTDMEY